MLRRKKVLLLETEFELGTFDPDVQGMYRNVEVFFLEVKARRTLHAEVHASAPIDLEVVGQDGCNLKFIQGVTDARTGPLPIKAKGRMALILGIYRGDKADVKATVWME